MLNVTSQGQISIPANVRKHIGFKTPGRAIAFVEGNKFILEPVKDLFKLGGVLNAKAKKETTSEIIKMENEAIKDFKASKFKK